MPHVRAAPFDLSATSESVALPTLFTIHPPMFIDTHTHIYTEEFDADRAEVVERARKAGARALLLPNIDEASLQPMMKMAEDYPGFCFPMMGLHPTELPEDPTPLLDRMEQMLSETPEKFVAVGEVGIDLYWDKSRREEQTETFKRQAEWAITHDLPLVIHTRSAHRELVEALLDIIAGHGGNANILRGVFHCFSGSAEQAQELLTRFPNFFLGIGGVVTFKNAKLAATLCAAVPLSRLVVETDAPYLTPAPHRGTRNEPSYVPFVIRKLAETYELPVADVETTILDNTLRLFHLPA